MQKNKNGFTIVELVIVIAIVGILAAISIVAYNGTQRRANTAAVAAALNSTKNQLGVYKLSNGSLPTSLAAAGINDQDVYLEYTRITSTSPATYCVTASLGGVAQTISATSAPTDGVCSGHVGARPGGTSPVAPSVDDDWTAANGTSWTTSKWQTASGGSSGAIVDVFSNTGRITAQGHGNAWGRGLYTAGTAASSQGFTIDVKVNNVESYSNGTIFFLVSAGAPTNETPANGFGLAVAITDGGIGSTELVRFNNGRTNASWSNASGTPIASLSSFTIKIERNGTLTQAKVWATGTAEPANWLKSWNDTTNVAAGRQMLAVRANASVGPSVSFDNFKTYTP